MSVACGYVVIFSLFSLGSTTSNSRPHSGHGLRRAFAIDTSGEPIDLGKTGASQKRCLCHSFELLKSRSSVSGDTCVCADQEAGVVMARSCACTRAGSRDPADGSCLCEHTRQIAGSLLPDVARSLAARQALKPARRVGEVPREDPIAKDHNMETSSTERISDGQPLAQVFTEEGDRELDRDKGDADASQAPHHSHPGEVGGVKQGASSSVTSRNKFVIRAVQSTQGGGSEAGRQPNFGGFVLGCIDADFRKSNT